MKISLQPIDSPSGTFLAASNLGDAFEIALIAKRKLDCNPVICTGREKDGTCRLAVYVTDLIVVEDPVN